MIVSEMESASSSSMLSVLCSRYNRPTESDEVEQCIWTVEAQQRQDNDLLNYVHQVSCTCLQRVPEVYLTLAISRLSSPSSDEMTHSCLARARLLAAQPRPNTLRE